MKSNWFVKIILIILLVVTITGCCAKGNIENEVTTTPKNTHTVAETSATEFATEFTTADEAQTAELTIHFEDEFPADTRYHDYIADITENSVIAVISTNVTVKNFKFLSLEFTEVSEEGDISFDMQELYFLKELTPSKPFRVKMTMFGTIPTYGISYEDNNGEIKNFSIGLSGVDGSLLLSEF